MSISATAVRFDDYTMWIDLSDGRTLGVPLAWFPRLLQASPAARERVEISRVGFRMLCDVVEDAAETRFGTCSACLAALGNVIENSVQLRPARALKA